MRRDISPSSKTWETLVGSFAMWGLFGFLLVTVLWWGAAQRVAVIVTSCALLVIFALSWRAVARVSSPLFWPLVACALWTLVAVVPMPIGALQFFSPKAGELWASCMQLFQAPAPRWVTASIDPAASYGEALKWCSYALVAWLAATVSRTRGLNIVLTSVFAIAVFLAIAALIVATVQGDLAWLAGKAEGKIARVPSFLINPNNLAGYLNLGGFCGLGLIASRNPPASKTILALGVCVVLASSVWSGSRAGVAVLFLFLVVLGLWWMPRWLREQERTSQARAALGASLVLGIPGLAWLGASTELFRDLLSDDLSKFGLLPRVIHAVRDYWLTGTGRGGFESVSQLYLLSSTNVVFRYVENFFFSWIVEWGIPFGTLLGLGLAFILRPRYLCLRRGAPAQAAYLGVLAVLLQNTMDLGLELFSLTAAVVAILAALLASRGSRGGNAPWPFPRKSLCAAAAVVMMLVGIVGAIASGPDGYTARRQLEERWVKTSRGPDTLAQLLPELQRHVLSRPADPYPFVLGAVAAWEGKQRILPWAAAALERAPAFGRAHLMVALGLVQVGASKQALVHLVETVRHDPALSLRAAFLASQMSAEPGFFVRSVGESEASAQLLVGVARYWSSAEQRAARRVLAERALALAPQSSQGLQLLAGDLLQEIADTKKTCGTQQTPGCEHLARSLDGTFKRIEQLAERLARVDRCSAIQISARRFAIQDEAAQALVVLDGCNECSSPAGCLRTAASIAQTVDDATRAALEQQYIAASCGQDEACGRAEAWVGQLAEQRGDWLNAHLQYARAGEISPKGEYWMAAARAAVRAERVGDAERAYQRAQSLGAKDAQLQTAIENLKKNSLQKLLMQ